MKSHASRTVLIVGAFGLALTALVLVSIFAPSPESIGPCATALGLLAPAVVDALLVERRRRNPETPAISDDVRPAE